MVKYKFNYKNILIIFNLISFFSRFKIQASDLIKIIKKTPRRKKVKDVIPSLN